MSSSAPDLELSTPACDVVQLPVRLLLDTRMSPRAVSVYGILATRREAVIDISQDALAELAGRSQCTVGRMLRQLHECGWITMLAPARIELHREPVTR